MTFSRLFSSFTTLFLLSRCASSWCNIPIFDEFILDVLRRNCCRHLRPPPTQESGLSSRLLPSFCIHPRFALLGPIRRVSSDAILILQKLNISHVYIFWWKNIDIYDVCLAILLQSSSLALCVDYISPQRSDSGIAESFSFIVVAMAVLYAWLWRHRRSLPFSIWLRRSWRYPPQQQQRLLSAAYSSAASPSAAAPSDIQTSGKHGGLLALSWFRAVCPLRLH